MKETELDLFRDDDGELPAYAWPGGYPVYYLDRKNSVLCPKCANKSDNEEEVPQFRPMASGINWEDTDLTCDNCNEHIESAYAEKENDND